MPRQSKRPKPIVLTVLDGWGYRAETKGNAIALARKPNYDRLLKEFPNTLIHTSGPSVGLPEGQMGNSEVGHLNIGAGRIVQMDITRIDQLIASGEFFAPAAAARSHGARPRAPASPARPGQRWRRPFAHRASLTRCCAWPAKIKSRAFSSTASWTAATPRRNSGIDFLRAARTENARIRRRPDRHRDRPLLRHGPRQSLGAHRKSLSRDGPRRRGREIHRSDRRHSRQLRKRRHRRIRRPRRHHHRSGARQTRSPSRPDPRRRCRDLLQFPRRPRPPDHPRPRRARLRQEFTDPARPEKSRLRRHDAVRKDLALAALPARARKARTHPRQRLRRARITKICASRKPKNTRTSPISSMAAWKNPSRAKSASWCRRRKCPPTI